MDLDILCIGSAGFDIFISGKELKPDKFSVENNIELKNDSFYKIDHSIYEAGGSALNSSILYARQGIAVGCLARTGKDHLANQIKIIAKHEGVNTEAMVSTPEHHTDLNIHIVTERASEINLGYNNSSIALRAKDAKVSKLKAQLIYFADLPEDFKIFRYYCNWAKVNKAQIYTNIKNFKAYKKRQINFVLANSNKVLTSLKLASAYFGEENSPVEIIRKMNGIGVQSLVLYDITSNSYAFEDDTIFMSSTYKKLNPLDITGSDDVFAAGYVSEIFQQKSVPQALTMASANACSVMEIFGARIAILKKPALRTLRVETQTL